MVFQKLKRKSLAFALSFTLTFSALSGFSQYDASAVSYSEMSALDQYAYSGNDLGATYSKQSTTFKVWAPTASKVQIKRYTKGSDSESGAAVIETKDMTKESQGIWSITISGDLAGTYYTYLVTVNGTTNETNDIYARTTGVNGKRAMVIDLDSTDPEGWDSDQRVSCPDQTDAIIWEAHVRDFSSSSDSGMVNKGKFLAFTEKNTTVNNDGQHPTGVSYLKDLGITHVHLLPVYDYGSVDETKLDTDQFNWGYDPMNYNTPEGSYSTNPYDGNVRVKEFKQMVKSLHEENIGVVMDVVYNHTYSGGSGKNDWFDYTVPGYYYRQKADGTYSNGSGCGNETASDRAMYQKYMIDSVVYWATEYHIDGFRFDLMGIHDVDTMNKIREALDRINPDILIYGEPWTAETTPCPKATAVQGNMNQVSERVAAFNDKVRDAIKGSCFNATDKGFIQGAGYEEALKGSIQANSTTMSGTNAWSKQPSQTVTYTSAHDNYTLYDKLVKSVKGGYGYGNRYDDLAQMNKLAGGIVLTSQGMSFFQAGEEFARSKYGDGNSYKSATSVNQLKWTNTITFADVKDYYKGLIKIRKAYKPFRDPTNTTNGVMYFSWGTSLPANVVAYTMYNKLNTGGWDYVAVIHNANADSKTVQLMTYENKTLPSHWVIVADGTTAGTKSLGTTGSSVTVPARSTMVLVDKTSFDNTVIEEESQVKVNHIIKSTGNTYKTETLKGKPGTSYTTSPLQELLDSGYVVSSVTGDTSSTYTAANKVVNYYYDLDASKYGTVTVNYVDESGKTIKESKTLTGKIGEAYSVTPDSITGYESLGSAQSGTYKSGASKITFTYKAVSKVFYLKNNASWSSPYAYTWNDAAQKGDVAWPGTKMTLVDSASKLYKVELPADSTSDMIIFDNAAGTQTDNIKMPTDGNNCYDNSTGTWSKYVELINVTSVSLNKTSAELEKGNTVALTATVNPSNATDKSVTWTSSNSAVASVSSTGVVTAVSKGTAVITVKTTDGGYTATCNVTVTEPVGPTEDLVNTSFVAQHAIVGQKVVLKGSATGGDGNYKFAYYYRRNSDKTWKTAGTEWGTSQYATFKPGYNEVYEICIKVQDGTGNIVKKYLSLAANYEENDLECYGTVSSTIYKYGKTIKITGSAENNSGAVKYKYEFRKASSWTFETIKDYSSSTSVNWTAPQRGAFTIRITADDGTNKAIRTINIKVK